MTYFIWTAIFSPVAGSTLHTAHCTLHIANITGPGPAHEPSPVHFILHIEHCTLRTTGLHCMLNIYLFTLQKPTIRPSGA